MHQTTLSTITLVLTVRTVTKRQGVTIKQQDISFAGKGAESVNKMESLLIDSNTIHFGCPVYVLVKSLQDCRNARNGIVWTWIDINLAPSLSVALILRIQTGLQLQCSHDGIFELSTKTKARAPMSSMILMIKLKPHHNTLRPYHHNFMSQDQGGYTKALGKISLHNTSRWFLSSNLW